MVRKFGEVSLEERQAKATEDITRKLRSVPARKDRVNESLAALQEFSDSGGTLFQSRNRGRATSLNQQLHKNCSEEVAEFLEVAKDREPPQIKGKVHSRERVHWRKRKWTNDELEVDMIEMADDSRDDLDHDYHMDREENGQHEIERNDFIELASIVHDAGFDADAMEFYKPPSSKPPLNLDDITTLIVCIQAEYLRKLLSDIEKLKELDVKAKTQLPMSRQQLMQFLVQQGEILPLWIGGVDGFPPPSVGAVEQPSTSPLKIGDAVAALVDENWILAEVEAALTGGKFELKDVDDDQRAQLILPRSCIIPLPKYRADPKIDGHAIFPRDAIVLALYPQTTCFYRGVVHNAPETSTEMYSIMFEDSSYPSGYSPTLPIHQRYVVSYRDPPDARDR
ncbi:hypothetical protein PRIPAC_79640 [Pristionchus pacificus]|uniref:SGF29 C-terminal domain-containing protein n=1 Tax=Pristionchus pacificus TaxID=54126 RepID=A0A2A6CPM0_PRIPA|nr:hypothetical protein PRIPAC_79640 [Pristionchus pacificus]|eukprot:PDM80155.1 hypothetical protein PRIPAC_32734 [Pristionchus pacificus]